VPSGFEVWGFLPGTQLIRPLNATDWRRNMTVVMFGTSYIIMKNDAQNRKIASQKS
jgi:hypothetical protein